LIIRYCLICVFLCKGFQAKTEIPLGIAYADSIFNAGNYAIAAMEYEKIFFFSENSEERSIALLKKSYCYKSLSRFDKATATLNRIDIGRLPDSVQFSVRYEKAINSFLSDNYTDAENYLAEINYYTPDSSLKAECLFLEILTKNELQKWNEADSLIYLYLSTNNIKIDSSELKSLLKKPKLRNPNTAKFISYIIPGSGQIASGHVFKGLSSLIFFSSSAMFTVLSIESGFYISGLTTGLVISDMFYFGGARHASFLVNKKNTTKKNAYNKQIRNFLLKTESNMNQ